MGAQPEPAIHIGCEPIKGAATFYIRDNGIGIAPRYLKKIFGLFERLDPNINGTGIGLAIAKRIIEVHKGTIWAESTGLNSGTTFYFTLPLAEGVKKNGAN